MSSAVKLSSGNTTCPRHKEQPSFSQVANGDSNASEKSELLIRHIGGVSS